MSLNYFGAIQNELSSKALVILLYTIILEGVELLVQEHVSVRITVKILIRFFRMN